MSQAVINQLKRTFGTQTNDWQFIRWQFYSSVQYPAAGTAALQFFSSPTTSVTKHLTNIPKANSIGNNHFLIKRIGLDYWIKDEKRFTGTTNADATWLSSDILAGFFNAGVFQLRIGDKIYLQQPVPFLTMPDTKARWTVCSAGFTAAAPAVAGQPFTDLDSDLPFVLDPPIFLEAEQPFITELLFPSGQIPVIATDVVNDTTNPLYVQCVFDGLLFRRVQ